MVDDKLLPPITKAEATGILDQTTYQIMLLELLREAIPGLTLDVLIGDITQIMPYNDYNKVWNVDWV